MSTIKGRSVQLAMTILKQGKRYIAYAPALDLSTSGKSLREVQERFKEIVDIFFEEVEKKGTLDEVLQDLGWIKLKTKWTPPKIVSQKSFDINVPVAV